MKLSLSLPKTKMKIIILVETEQQRMRKERYEESSRTNEYLEDLAEGLHGEEVVFELKAEGAKVMHLIVRDVVLGREEFVQDHSFSAIHCGDIDVKSSDPSPAELDQGSH